MFKNMLYIIQFSLNKKLTYHSLHMEFEGMRLFHLILVPKHWSQTWWKKDRSDCCWIHFFAAEQKLREDEKKKKKNTMRIDDSFKDSVDAERTKLQSVSQFIGP